MFAILIIAYPNSDVNDILKHCPTLVVGEPQKDGLSDVQNQK